MAAAADAAQLHRRLQHLKGLRSKHEDVWAQCFEYTYPLRGNGLRSERLDANSGQERQARILDSTATDSVRTLAAALQSGTTPSNSQWFQLSIDAEETDPGMRWLDAGGKRLWELIHAANFDAARFECCIDGAVAGWWALYIDEDRERGGLTFEQWAISGLYCATTKAGGRIDTVFREFELTAEQCVRDFGENACSDATRTLARDKPDDMVLLCHAIYPRALSVPGARMARNLPIASCTFEAATKHLLRESGYHEMPVIVPRWMAIPGSVYGVGPMFDALPDTKMLNDLRRLELANVDMAVSGMWIAEDDGVLNPRTVKVGARKVIVANSVDSMKELKSGARFDVAWTEAEMLQRAIRKILMADQLQPQDGPAMTATEVHARIGLIRQLLGPIYGRLQAEDLGPTIERCFGLAYRAGALGEPPAEMAGREYRVRYISPMARAQKLEEVSAIERLSVNVAAMAQTMPSALDLIDPDEAVRTMADGLGVPLKIMLDADAVTALRDARAKQQQQAAQQAQQQQMQTMAAESAMKQAAAA